MYNPMIRSAALALATALLGACYAEPSGEDAEVRAAEAALSSAAGAAAPSQPAPQAAAPNRVYTLAQGPFPDAVDSDVTQWSGLSSVSDGTGPLINAELSGNNHLKWGSETWGVDLIWSDSSLWRVEAESGTTVSKGQRFALRVWGGGWVKHSGQTWGVDLDFSDTPVYEWYAIGQHGDQATHAGEPLSGSFALWNDDAKAYLVHAHETFGIDLDWHKPKLGPQRTISVTPSAASGGGLFAVSGMNFTPGALIVLRATDPNLHQLQFTATADGNGAFMTTLNIPCNSFVQITFTAFEDADPSRTFANSVVTSCPSAVAPPPPMSCTFRGTSVASGQSVTAYEAPSVLCDSCNPQQRVCSNGVLSGTFQYSSCVTTRPKPPASCP